MQSDKTAENPSFGDSKGDRERLELVLEATGLDLWENDLISGSVPRHASKVLRELGYETDKLHERIHTLFGLVHPDDVAAVKTAIEDHVNGVSEHYESEFRLRSKSGQWVWYANYGRIMDRDASQPGRRFIGVAINVDERKRKEQELAFINRKLAEQNARLEDTNATLQSLASSDPLTGIANRRRLLDKGDDEVRRAQRLDHTLSLLIIDIDSFKGINDRWGHMVGDRVICAVADACSQSLRRDVDLVARIGGEEFAALLPETDLENAIRLAERVRENVNEIRVTVDETVLHCSVSIGVATLVRNGGSFHELLIRADKALYAAKKAGKNCVKHTRS